MRTTNRNARMDASGRHNDRNFDLSYAPHIDPELTKNNKYWVYDGDSDATFRDAEMKFYEEHFKAHLDTQNDRNIKAGNKKRCKTLEGYYTSKTTRPEDKILEIGNFNEHATEEELWSCAMEYKDRFERLFGSHCKILDMALHVDEPESAPHVHIRRVWISSDKDGHECVTENGALKDLGFISSPDRPEGRRNNLKVTFTSADRELFQEICIEHGLDIERVPEKNRKRLTKEQHLVEELEKKRAELEREVSALNEEVIMAGYAMKDLDRSMDELEAVFENGEQFDAYSDELLEASKKEDKYEKYRLYAEILCRWIKSEASSLDGDTRDMITAPYRDKIGELETFLKKHGYDKEFDEERKGRKTRRDPNRDDDALL